MHFLHVNIYNPWWLLDTFWLVSEKRVNVSLDFVCLLLCLKEFTLKNDIKSLIILLMSFQTFMYFLSMAVFNILIIYILLYFLCVLF